MEIQYKLKNGFIFPLLCLIILSMSACKAQRIVADVVPESFRMKRILILPFKNMSALRGENVSIRCALCGNVFTTGKVDEGAGDFLTEHLTSLLSKNTALQLVPPSQAQGVLSALLFKEKKELPELDLLVAIGRNLDADAVLLGRVYRFKERKGAKYSIESPASVAFDIDLVSVAEKRLIWNGNFDETQRSLSENLLKLGTFLKRKGQWITAESLSASGLEKVHQTFPMPK